MRHRNVSKAITAVYLVLITICGGWVTACGGNNPPKLSPEGQAAVTGRQVIAAANAVVTGIDTAMTSGQLNKAVGIQVLQAIRQVGVQAQTLADALKVVDSTKNAAEMRQGLDAAKASLASIQAALVSAVSPITDPATKTQVDTLLKGLTDAVVKVQQILSGVTNPSGPEPEPVDVWPDTVLA